VYFFKPSLPLRPALKRSITGPNEIAVLGPAWKRLINDGWHLAVAGYMLGTGAELHMTNCERSVRHVEVKHTIGWASR
jgi:hypothetical protein